MKLVVEGTERYKRIISAGYSDYVAGENQTIIEIKAEDWKGYRKIDIHWDDELKKIIEAPYPLSAVELIEKQDAEVQEIYIKAIPDLIKSMEARIAALESKQ